ncbi:MAG: ATP phosphoribosyltransferase regulatory subunit, partial [Dehalococcoidales bacterium]|nr:ATP phosphoribosyltransferase regulatory subunit [Dehalococcoidales bacterium]
IDITSGRGFEYYTGVMFQFLIDDEKVGGGGRYDALIPLMGGRDTPASGFALYLDRLMNLIRPAATDKSSAQIVLITAKKETAAMAFKVASTLREAGYIAGLSLGGPEPTETSWTLDIREKTPSFVLTNIMRQKSSELATVDEILMVLSRENLPRK